eukprot:Skav229626  [mRNA]  locus=scaffold1753:343575:348479:- [translate_table: standard]
MKDTFLVHEEESYYGPRLGSKLSQLWNFDTDTESVVTSVASLEADPCGQTCRNATVKVCEGALLPGIKVAPARRSELTTTGPCSFSKELRIPPDGLRLFYTVLAACRPKAWQAQSQDHSGFFCSGKVERGLALAAKELRKKFIMLKQSRGELASAAHLLRGGHPGREELGQI